MGRGGHDLLPCTVVARMVQTFIALFFDVLGIYNTQRIPGALIFYVKDVVRLSRSLIRRLREGMTENLQLLFVGPNGNRGGGVQSLPATTIMFYVQERVKCRPKAHKGFVRESEERLIVNTHIRQILTQK